MKNTIENLLKLQTLESLGIAGNEKQKHLAELRARIPTPILAHYDRLVVRGKKVVAVIRNQVCSGCHVQVPRNTELILMHGTDIQICESCGCYLCLPEHISPAKPEVKIKKTKTKPTSVRLQTV